MFEKQVVDARVKPGHDGAVVGGLWIGDLSAAVTLSFVTHSAVMAGLDPAIHGFGGKVSRSKS